MAERATAPESSTPQVRIPTQPRAKRTVASILDATTQLLIEGGMGAVNTNAVAELAGVNVATVYSYFPDKIAIVRQLAQQFEDQRSAYVAGMTKHLADDDWREWFSVVIDQLAQFRIDVHGGIAIRKAVMGEVELRHLDEETTATTTEGNIEGLRAHNPELTVEHARLISGVVVRTITEIVDSAFATTPPDMGQIRELKLLVIRYLAPYLDRPSTRT